MMNSVASKKQRMNTAMKVLLLGTAMVWLFSAVSATNKAIAEQKIYKPTCNPELIFSGIPTSVLIRAQLSYDPNLVSSSVNLLRIMPDGSSVLVAQMYDDGTHGDPLKGDESFTAVVPLNEPNPTTIKFRVSAGYKGQARRLLSDMFTLDVLPYPNLEQIWNQFVTKLVNKDMEGALSYMRDRAKTHYRQVFTQVGMDTVSEDFRSVRDLKLKDIVPDRATFTFTATIDGKDQTGRVTFWCEREWDDTWRINSFGFRE
jgi:hypothetical protein